MGHLDHATVSILLRVSRWPILQGLRTTLRNVCSVRIPAQASGIPVRHFAVSIQRKQVEPAIVE